MEGGFTMKIDKDFKTIFSLRLKQLMEENNETIYTIATVVNLSPSTISRYQKGIMSPKIPTVRILAQHFNVSPAWLIGASDERTPFFADNEDDIDLHISSLSSSLSFQSKQKLLSFAQFLLSNKKQ